MLIIPAIDLKDGRVVRYTKGRLNKKVYSSDPVSVALDWQEQGAKFLHLVDLDGAICGRQKNLKVIKKIIKKINIPAEAGGGIRDLSAIQKVIDCGVKRVILGTRAIEDIDFLSRVIEKFGQKIALGLDASGQMLGLRGWRKTAKISLKDYLKSLENLNLKTVIYTDISRDGTLSGINLPAIKKVLRSSAIDFIVSGGVSSLVDIKKLANLDCLNFKGVIVGKALYEKRFSLKEAIALSENLIGFPLRKRS